MAGVALRLRKLSLRSSANEKGIDSLIVRLKPIKATSANLLTFIPKCVEKPYPRKVSEGKNFQKFSIFLSYFRNVFIDSRYVESCFQALQTTSNVLCFVSA